MEQELDDDSVHLVDADSEHQENLELELKRMQRAQQEYHHAGIMPPPLFLQQLARIEAQVAEQSRSLISIRDVNEAQLMDDCLADVILNEFQLISDQILNRNLFELTDDAASEGSDGVTISSSL